MRYSPLLDVGNVSSRKTQYKDAKRGGNEGGMGGRERGGGFDRRAVLWLGVRLLLPGGRNLCGRPGGVEDGAWRMEDARFGNEADNSAGEA